MSPPRKKKRSNEEDVLQRNVAKLLKGLGWRFTHVPSGGNRDEITGAHLKAAGLSRGVPDLLIFEPWTKTSEDGRYVRSSYGVAIELKVQRRKPSDFQEAWLADLEDDGWLTAVCYSVSEVVKVIKAVRPKRGRRLL